MIIRVRLNCSVLFHTLHFILDFNTNHFLISRFAGINHSRFMFKWEAFRRGICIWEHVFGYAKDCNGTFGTARDVAMIYTIFMFLRYGTKGVHDVMRVMFCPFVACRVDPYRSVVNSKDRVRGLFVIMVIVNSVTMRRDFLKESRHYTTISCHVNPCSVSRNSLRKDIHTFTFGLSITFNNGIMFPFIRFGVRKVRIRFST